MLLLVFSSVLMAQETGTDLTKMSGHTVQLDTAVLKPSAVNGKEAKAVVGLLTQYHYRKTPFSDSVSSVFLDNYLKSLDPSKSYLTAADIRRFESYRFRLDNLIGQENVEPAFAMHQVFRKRCLSRLDAVLNDLIKRQYDFSTPDFHESDRDKAAWASSEAELDQLWINTIKSQVLSLKLSGKKEQEIESTLRTRYERFRRSVIQTNAEDVFSQFLNALTESYDPHTNYLSPRASDLFKQSMSLSLEGIGARLQTDNDYTKVYEIVPGGPADKSGLLHNNDLITGVAQGDEGEFVDIIGWRVDDVVKLIKGPKGTIVRLQVLPAVTGINGPTSVIRLERDKIKLEDQAAKKTVISVPQGNKTVKFGVIDLPAFYMDFDAYNRRDPNYRSTTRDVRKLIGELKQEGVTGLIIDLRNNGGGSLTEAIDLTGLFIPQGPVVQVKSAENRIDHGVDDDPSVVWDGPLLVMTNRFSASASEIFAGAIQDYKRGVIYGESTFGKGTVQQVINLRRRIPGQEPVGELKVTYQKFYRVSGSSTQNKGVEPDVVMPSAYDADKFGERAQPAALPWDRIKPAGFMPSNAVDERTTAHLRKYFQDRMKHDQILKNYLSETEELRKNINETRVSLQEAQRKKEMEEAEQRKGQTNLDTRVGSKELKNGPLLPDMKDAVLREGVLLLSELSMRKIG